MLEVSDAFLQQVAVREDLTWSIRRRSTEIVDRLRSPVA
jgi:hypothetical protein